MTAVRAAKAIGGGVLQMLVGVVLAILSIDSIGLVSDDDFSLNWPLAIPSFIVLATIGFSVALIARHPRWPRVGVLSTVLGIVAALLASFAVGSIAVGMLVFLVVQLLLPTIVSANHQPREDRATV